MIDTGNKATGGLKKICFAYGILGFVRFLQDYYVYLITKASTACIIGDHKVYQIDDTKLLSVGSFSKPNPDRAVEEQRYVDTFTRVDLNKNFYFSYTYDLTNTLQKNLMCNSSNKFNGMFVWNQYLLETGFRKVNKKSPWILPIIHGFVDQKKFSSMGKSLYLTLIARRSRQFAGARFLKRGINDNGFVANEVETEQLVFDRTSNLLNKQKNNPYFTSYVQHRGSIPLFWSQESNNMSPKPPIQINITDPFYSATALHFDNLFDRYGAPIIALNLVKHKENTKRESILLDEYTQAVTYLNQFLPCEKQIKYVAFDMSRASKTPGQEVIKILEDISREMISKTQFFHTGGEPVFNAFRAEMNKENQSSKEDSAKSNLGYRSTPLYQNGVVRTNCIDCLDRTNAAQFIVGKTALQNQLYVLGFLDKPYLSIEADIVKMLMSMYHDHGNIIAMQYGGSALVNTMETYRTPGAWTSQSRDMIETIKRYYSNSFTDAEKQDAINLFLGNYIVDDNKDSELWDMNTDFHLHHGFAKTNQKSYRNWFTAQFLEDNSSDASLRNSSLVTDFDSNYKVHEYVSFNEDFVFRKGLTMDTDIAENMQVPKLSYSPFSGNDVDFSSEKPDSPVRKSLAESKLISEAVRYADSDDEEEEDEIVAVSNRALNDIFVPPNFSQKDSLTALTSLESSKSSLSREDRPISLYGNLIPGLAGLSTKVLVLKALNPEVSLEECDEYSRYVRQFKSEESWSSMHNEEVKTQDLYESDDYNTKFYASYLERHNQSGHMLATSHRDKIIYERYCDFPKFMADSGPNLGVSDTEGYARWLKTGYY